MDWIKESNPSFMNLKLYKIGKFTPEGVLKKQRYCSSVITLTATYRKNYVSKKQRYFLLIIIPNKEVKQLTLLHRFG